MGHVSSGRDRCGEDAAVRTVDVDGLGPAGHVRIGVPIPRDCLLQNPARLVDRCPDLEPGLRALAVGSFHTLIRVAGRQKRGGTPRLLGRSSENQVSSIGVPAVAGRHRNRHQAARRGVRARRDHGVFRIGFEPVSMSALRDALRDLSEDVFFDLLESDDAYLLVLDVPGVSAESLDLAIEDGRISIDAAGRKSRPATTGTSRKTGRCFSTSTSRCPTTRPMRVPSRRRPGRPRVDAAETRFPRGDDDRHRRRGSEPG